MMKVPNMRMVLRRAIFGFGLPWLSSGSHE
jgi:hypothetical protein